MSPTASDADKAIGAAVALYRGELTQQALAEAMKARNPLWRWSQATVWSIEKGERPLRLAEARDLAEILEVHIARFFDAEDTARHGRELKVFRRGLQREYVAASDCLESLLLSRRFLKQSIMEAEKAAPEAVDSGLIERAQADLRSMTPERALRRGMLQLADRARFGEKADDDVLFDELDDEDEGRDGVDTEAP